MPAPKSSSQKTEHTRSQEIFLAAEESYRELIKRVLREERDVMHMQTRAKIHQRIIEHVRQTIQ